jgi:hypothetical protein
VLRLMIVLVVSTLVPNAFAGHWDGIEGPRHHAISILCEGRLEKSKIEQREENLSTEIFGRPFFGWIPHDVTALGLQKMGLDTESTERELKDLVLVAEHKNFSDALVATLYRYRNGTFDKIQSYTFAKPDAAVDAAKSELKAYQQTDISESDKSLSYDELKSKSPSNESRRPLVGYHSEPDKDGVRIFIAFVEHPGSGDGVSAYVQYGIDVPYDQAQKYSDDLAVTDDLRTPAGRYMRIAVLSFARVD